MKHKPENVTDKKPKKASRKDKSKTSVASTSRSSRSPKSSKVTLNASEVDVDKAVSSTSTTLTSVTSKSAIYKPIPYVFRIPSNLISLADGHNTAKCPPFFIQLDHALAVVWTIFSKEKMEKPLGVAQLQWALSFLKGIRNKQGKHPRDIAICIEAMEDALLQQYAAMADTVKLTDENSFIQSKPTLSTHTIASNAEKSLVTQKLPFSVNYAEMSRYIPQQSDQIYDAQCDISTTRINALQQLDKFKRTGNFPLNFFLKGSSLAKGNTVEALKMRRKEQISKLQEELERLHSIETFICNFDKHNFKPYLNSQQVDVLVSKKSKHDSDDLHATCFAISSKKLSREPSRTKRK
ncbi:hypothetical protein ILUMI_06986 [Ignelater luminosus]|uniref:Uncharacterized protein n=1 Tax=Ignelater luminosus TaxID=2038154 RepID=A0A8K0D4Q4_IGNLU|nr:hypothetical protein ILUMI_06986 [Ignelater luminosus]